MALREMFGHLIKQLNHMDDEQKKEFEERKKAFLNEYKEVIDKHNLDLFSYPLCVPDGTGGFKLVVQTDIVDTKNKAVPSPFSTT